MTADELKVKITADTSQFQREISRVKSSLGNIGASGTKSISQLNRTFDKVGQKTSRATAKYVKEFTKQLDFMIDVYKTKLEALSNQFASSGFNNNFLAGEIDSSDAYLRSLEKLKEALQNGLVLDTGDIGAIPETIESMVDSINNADFAGLTEAEIESEKLDTLMDKIEETIIRINELKLSIVDESDLTLIREYQKELRKMAQEATKLTNKIDSGTYFGSAKYEEFYRDKGFAEAMAPARMPEDKGEQIGKNVWTISKAMLGVRGIYMLIRRIVNGNEKMSAAMQGVWETINAGVKPILDLLATIIMAIFKVVGRLFGITVGGAAAATATADNTEKALTIAKFDELETLAKDTGGGVGVGVGGGGVDEWLSKLDEKLGWIYKIVDKIRAVVKENLPGGPNNDELGVPRVTQDAYNQVYGDTSIGYNVIPVVTGGEVNLINVAEIEKGAQKWSNFFAKVREGWNNLKETASNNGEAIAESNRFSIDSQVEAWNTFKENVKTKWEELKQRFVTNAEQRRLVEQQTLQAQTQAWETFKTNVTQKWEQLKNTTAEKWEQIKNSITQKWNDIKSSVSEGWENIKSKFNSSINSIKSWFWGIPESLRQAMNSVIGWVEGGINNIIWKINNSGVMNFINRATGWGLAINSIWIPRLASGGVINSPTMAMMGEYPGASRNPEIVTPQSLMRETMDAANSELASVYVQIGRQIIEAIERKDLDITIGDSAIARAAARGNRQHQLATGVSLF